MSDPPRENGTRTPGNLKTTGLDDSMDYDDKNINGHNSINNSKGDGKKDEENGGRSSIPVLMETEENSTGTDHADQPSSEAKQVAAGDKAKPSELALGGEQPLPSDCLPNEKMNENKSTPESLASTTTASSVARLPRTTKRPKRKQPPQPQQQQQQKAAPSSANASSFRRQTFVPVRDYYHSISFTKFTEDEWDNDVDSADEGDGAWRPSVENSRLQDLSDEVSQEERDFMVLWNDFIRSDTIIPANTIPQKNLIFIEQYAAKIKRENMEEHLLLHLCNLYDEGLVSGDHIAGCMEHYHKLAVAAVAAVESRPAAAAAATTESSPDDLMHDGMG